MTDVPSLGEADFLALLQAHLPQGAAWPRDPDRELTLFLAAFADGMASQHAEAVRLMAEADPATTGAMLTDWETTVGLPDACFALLDTLEERRGAVVARLAARGGQSPAYYIELCARYGWDIGVYEHRLFRAGVGRVGDPVASATGEMFRAGVSTVGQPLARTNWAHRWRVSAAPIAVDSFQAGRSTAGQPLRLRDHPPVRCLIETAKPAHTTVGYAFPLAEPDPLDDPVAVETVDAMRAGDPVGIPLAYTRTVTFQAGQAPVPQYQ